MTDTTGAAPDSAQTSSEATPPSPEALQALREAFQLWQGSNHAAAIDRMELFYQQEPQERWVLALLCWWAQQVPDLGFPRGIGFAREALSKGMRWPAWNLISALLGNSAAYPQYVQPALELVEEFRISTPFAWAPSFDPIGVGWNLLAQGQDVAAVQVMRLTALPAFPSDLERLSELAGQHLERISGLADTAAAVGLRVSTLADESSQTIERVRTDLETKANQADILIDNVSSQTVNERFESTASRNEKQSAAYYKWGVAVLIAAAVVAALPLVLHYVNAGPTFNQPQLLGAHASATLAFATVSGVLLARARGRDRAHQRAHDLATALGTIIVYSGQIQDPAEKQRFMQSMVQMVLVAQLQADQKGSEESSISLPNLVAALRTPQAP